jgi:hypothetical protein
MDEFSYLSVLLSIIIGLAVTQLLTGMRGQMLARERVRGFWPTQVWAGVLLLVCTQTWWAMFDLRTRQVWDFSDFAILLAQTIALYLLTGLVYPDFSPDRAVDLRAHYFAQRRHLFSLFLGSTALSLGRDLILHHQLPRPMNLGFHLFWASFAVTGLMIAREGYHKFLALLAAATFVSYVVFLFSRLA